MNVLSFDKRARCPPSQGAGLTPTCTSALLRLVIPLLRFRLAWFCARHTTREASLPSLTPLAGICSLFGQFMMLTVWRRRECCLALRLPIPSTFQVPAHKQEGRGYLLRGAKSSGRRTAWCSVRTVRRACLHAFLDQAIASRSGHV